MWRVLLVLVVVGVVLTPCWGQKLSSDRDSGISELLVDLDAADLPAGALKVWHNKGSLAGSFEGESDSGQVEMVDGRRAVTFDGNFELKSTFKAGPEITGSSDYTVAVWVCNPSLSEEECIVAWSWRAGNFGTGAQLNFGAHPQYGAVSHWGLRSDMGFDGGVPSVGQWHQLAVTFDGTVERVYVDGALNAMANKSLNIHTGEPIHIGSAGGQLYFSGSIAQVQMYDQALSGADIARLYLQGTGSDRLRTWYRQCKEAQASLAASAGMVSFLRRKISDCERFGTKRAEYPASLDYIKGDLYFRLAQAMEKAGHPTKDITAAYQRSVVSQHSGLALAWLHKNVGENEYKAVLRVLSRHAQGGGFIPIITEELALRPDWSALERFLDVLFDEVQEPAVVARCVYDITRQAPAVHEQYLAYCRNEPSLCTYALQWDSQPAEQYLAKGAFIEAAEAFRRVQQFYSLGNPRSALEFRMYECLAQAGRNKEAVAGLERLVAKDGAVSRELAAGALRLKGRCQVRAGELDKAVESLLMLISEYPEAKDVPEVGFFIGYSCALRGKFQEAKEAFDYVARQYAGSQYAEKARTYVRRIQAMTE